MGFDWRVGVNGRRMRGEREAIRVLFPRPRRERVRIHAFYVEARPTVAPSPGTFIQKKCSSKGSATNNRAKL